MAEDDAFQHSTTNTDHDGHRLVELAALVRVGRLRAVGFRRANHAVELLEGRRRFFLCELHGPDDDHALAAVVLEP